MRYKKAILTFLALVLIGSSSVAYADTVSPEATQSETNQTSETGEESLAELYHKAGLDSPEVIISTLGRLGITKEELQAYVGQDKKIYDIIQEENISMRRFKRALTKEYRCRIRQATKDQVITKEEAKVLNDLLKERMKAWVI